MSEPRGDLAPTSPFDPPGPAWGCWTAWFLAWSRDFLFVGDDHEKRGRGRRVMLAWRGTAKQPRGQPTLSKAILSSILSPACTVIVFGKTRFMERSIRLAGMAEGRRLWPPRAKLVQIRHDAIFTVQVTGSFIRSRGCFRREKGSVG